MRMLIGLVVLAVVAVIGYRMYQDKATQDAVQQAAEQASQAATQAADAAKNAAGAAQEAAGAAVEPAGHAAN
jgi:predicted negative regulator of RcsB-dependent stress response